MNRLGSRVLLLSQNIRQKTRLALAVNYLVFSVLLLRQLNMEHLYLVHWFVKIHHSRFESKELKNND